MPDIKEARLRFRVLLAVLLLIAIAGAAILISPVGASSRTRQAELEQLRKELQAATLASEPLHGITFKVADARQEMAKFCSDRLPSSYATVSERLGALALENGVSISARHYKTEPSGVAGLQRLLIDASITGDYLHAVKFINATERESMFFVIDNVSLTEAQGKAVQIQIWVEAFLRES